MATPPDSRLADELSVTSNALSESCFRELEGRDSRVGQHVAMLHSKHCVLRLLLVPLAASTAGIALLEPALRQLLMVTVKTWAATTGVLYPDVLGKSGDLIRLFGLLASPPSADASTPSLSREISKGEVWEVLWMGALRYCPAPLLPQLLRVLRVILPQMEPAKVGAAFALFSSTPPPPTADLPILELIDQRRAPLDPKVKYDINFCQSLLDIVSSSQLVSERAVAEPSPCQVSVGSGHASTQLAIEYINLLRTVQPVSINWSTAVNMAVKTWVHPSDGYMLKALGLDGPAHSRPAVRDALPAPAQLVIRRALAALQMLGGMKDVLRAGGHVKVRNCVSSSLLSLQVHTFCALSCSWDPLAPLRALL